MQLLLILPLAFLVSCGLPQKVFDDAEQVLDDTAIKVEISREAVNQNADISTHIEITKHKG